jgi:hypothetical protein
MGKNVGLTYVKDFSFPAEQGFTGSAGVHKVRGYMRGGQVKKGGKKLAKGTTRMGEGGYYGKPGDKYPNKGARQTMPKNVKAKGGTVHDKLKSEGKKMGYAYGGQVKSSNTSAEFKQKRAKQDTMDYGVQPAQKGRNEAEVEAGGNKRLKAGYKEGGAVSKEAKKAIAAHVRRVRGPKRIPSGLRRRDTKKTVLRALAASKKGMPKNVKAKGGLAKYAAGGLAKKAGAAQ